MTEAGKAGATVIEGLKLTALMEDASKVMKGAVLAISGVTAIETVEQGVDLAIPAAAVASPLPKANDPAPVEVVKASFGAYKARKQGHTVVRMPDLHIAGHRPPRADLLTGVQYRMNALGFGAGPVDGIMGPRTRKAVIAFQREYPPLAVHGIPGPKTQAKLVQVCGY
jgi:hypothetical protein